MKKGQVVEGIVTRYDFPNKGYIYFDETLGDGTVVHRECMVKNVLPGQKIEVQIQKVKKGAGEGRLLQVLQNASYEIENQCPHFGECGGCAYQNVPYEKQLEIKGKQVEELLWNVIQKSDCADTYRFEGIKKSPVQFSYRNKMEFSFGDEVKDGPLALGMHKRGSFYDLVTVSECQIVDEDYRAIVKYVRDFFVKEQEGYKAATGENLSHYHRMRHEGYLRHLLVRKAVKTGEILLALVTSTQIDTSYEKAMLERFVKGLVALQENGVLKGDITGILHTKNDSVADVVKSDETNILYGKDYFYEELLGLKFKISEFSFFQTNSLGAEVLYSTAREFLGDIDPDGKKDKVVFDLYSGTGTIAQLMAPVAGKVIGVEIVEEAVEAAKKNAELNGLTNCEFIANDVLKALDEIEEKPDFIILDPPRDGIHPKALQKIIRYGVDRIVYISCKPTSLARDLEVFLGNGYKVERAVAVDMFPGTAHCETVCLLSKLHEACISVNIGNGFDTAL